MRILILVLSCQEEPFSGFMKAQMETWDSLSVHGVHTCYYYGSGQNEYNLKAFEPGIRLEIDCSDYYNIMHWKFKRALDAVPYHQYDMVFRTNSSSYIRKDLLLSRASTLPKKYCYAGWDNEGYISGAGIFLSPDVCEILRHSLTEEPHGAEDVLIGELLYGKVPIINDRSRVDATVEGCEVIDDAYHYRFKTSNDVADRHRDINNMGELHKKIIG